MKKVYLFILSLILLTTCQTEKDAKKAYVITGDISGDYDGYVYLVYPQFLDSIYKVKDSVKVIDGTFKFTGSTHSPVQGWLNLEGQSSIAWLLVENSTIDLKANYTFEGAGDNIYRKITIEEVIGSKSDSIKEDYRKFFRDNKAKANFDDLVKDKLSSIAKMEDTDGYTGKLLADNVVFTNRLNLEEASQILEQIDTNYVAPFERELIRAGINRLETFSGGKPILDFVLNDKNRDTINSADFRGKLLLIDFWASWCVPCRKKHPEYVKFYNENQDADFEILSVSIDKDVDAWQRAMEQDQMTWQNVIDKGGFEGKTAKDYFLYAIPYSYLVDKSGNVIMPNPTVEDIESYL
ncbi:redoxin domain-containing protein [Winogradskyella sp.]|uniref:redoxin domain-containing protein n=1 Tax=Winogradskyella sp. TaxID=1883156 RepID=UPI003BAAE61C